MSDLVFVRFGGQLDDLANELRMLFNVPSTNRRRGAVDQRRNSMNRGGTYYLLETGGLNLIIMENQGEVEESEMKGWPFYIEIRPSNRLWNEEWGAWADRHVADTLTAAGFETKVV